MSSHPKVYIPPELLLLFLVKLIDQHSLNSKLDNDFIEPI